MSEAWQHEEPFAVTNVHMLDADVLCDVTILAGKEKQEVRCHRFMLASRSPVFYTMFCGSLPEASVVEIPDVEADVFRTIVRFMYTGEIQLMPDSVMATMYAAKKYDIQPLTNRCKTFLEKEIAVENVCIILDQASKFEEKELIQQCLSFVSENPDLVFESDGFLSISSETMRYVLEQEKTTPKLPPEEVYASCKKWAKQSCSTTGLEVTDQTLRQKLGELILLVDIAGMSFESFTYNVVQENILSDSEKVTFLKELGERKKNVNSFRVERFSNGIDGWGYQGKQDGISFSTSKELSDLEDEYTLPTPQLPQYKGRETKANRLIKENREAQAIREVKVKKRAKDQEVKRMQEQKLEVRRRQEKHNFQLVKEDEALFRRKQAEVQEEIARKHEQLVKLEEQANRGLREQEIKQKFMEGQNVDANGNFVFEPETTTRKNVAHEPTVQNPAKFNLTGITRSGWGFEDLAVQEVDQRDPEPRPPTYRKRDIVHNTHQFNMFDKHAVKAPFSARESVAALVTYFREGAENHLQLVRMFYRWITFNVAFDVDGYYGESQLQSVEAEDVLGTGVTISEGYANLLAAMCRFEGIPVKVIQGIVKGKEYQIGDIINFTESHLCHFWNAVYINRNWFFIDCSWGAGLVDRKRKWNRHFQMIVDHFPFMDGDLRASSRWQLLASPISANSFNQRLKLERAALEWDVKPVTHTQHHIITVSRDLEVRLQEVADVLEEYSVQFQRKDGSRNLDRFFFACKLDNRTLKITVRPPEPVDYLLNIYGQKSLDAAGKSELLVTYILKCIDVHQQLRQFPPNFRIFGAVPSYSKFGFSSDITKCCEYTCNSGEMILPLKTKRNVKCMAKLEHIDERVDLTNYCLITAKDRGISIKMRFPFEGYYKFTLFGKEEDDGNFRPVATFMVDCNQASHVHSGFPVAFEAALELKCTLYKPLWKDLPANSTINIVIGCPNIVKASVMYHDLEMDENHVFEGTVTTPPAGQPFTIYGQKNEKSPLVGLFHFTIF
ncbi:uncharacterized protein LOC128219731 isoform X2 [Mya arenaria]|uniref:uncharacterized protein LOC128219731 isoform X2 n=1 Tax=Mya arenaria TaxID=6604 RepID=UPI0022E52F23|nr:uncharacterized protein LOC128219731 isoform X2 [Mya arenaria]